MTSLLSVGCTIGTNNALIRPSAAFSPPVHRAGMKASIFIFLYHFCALGVLVSGTIREG